MKSAKHTHRANCQNCGSLQAIDVLTNKIAKHGYTVKGWGFFNGVCTGSDRLPLQLERTYCDEQCSLQGHYAARLRETAAKYETGEIVPDTCGTGTYLRIQKPRNMWEQEEILVPFNEGHPYFQKKAVVSAIAHCNMGAGQREHYVATMQSLAKEIFSTAPIEVKAKAPLLDVKNGLRFKLDNGKTFEVRSLVKRGFSKSLNYAVCFNVNSPEEKLTISKQSIRIYVTKHGIVGE